MTRQQQLNTILFSPEVKNTRLAMLWLVTGNKNINVKLGDLGLLKSMGTSIALKSAETKKVTCPM